MPPSIFDKFHNLYNFIGICGQFFFPFRSTCLMQMHQLLTEKWMWRLLYTMCLYTVIICLNLLRLDGIWECCRYSIKFQYSTDFLGIHDKTLIFLLFIQYFDISCAHQESLQNRLANFGTNFALHLKKFELFQIVVIRPKSWPNIIRIKCASHFIRQKLEHSQPNHNDISPDLLGVCPVST